MNTSILDKNLFKILYTLINNHSGHMIEILGLYDYTVNGYRGILEFPGTFQDNPIL